MKTGDSTVKPHKLRVLMKQANLSAKEVCAKLHMDRSTLYRKLVGDTLNADEELWIRTRCSEKLAALHVLRMRQRRIISATQMHH